MKYREIHEKYVKLILESVPRIMAGEAPTPKKNNLFTTQMTNPTSDAQFFFYTVAILCFIGNQARWEIQTTM